VAWPADHWLRGVLVLDAEVAPKSGSETTATAGSGIKPFARYTLGSGFWLEVAL
jgi:hypothetical protein